jgi:hypothetical protein
LFAFGTLSFGMAKKILDNIRQDKKENIKLLNVRVTEKLYDDFDSICKKKKISISEAIRHLMAQVVSEETKEK